MHAEPDWGTMYPGESINFTCSLAVGSGWDFIWYHNSTEISTSGKIYRRDALDYSHSGNYQCTAKRGKAAYSTHKSTAKSLEVSGKIIHLLNGIVFLLHVLVLFSKQVYRSSPVSFFFFFF